MGRHRHRHHRRGGARLALEFGSPAGRDDRGAPSFPRGRWHMSLRLVGGLVRGAVRRWQIAAGLALLTIIIFLKLSLASEQVHSAKLASRLAETAHAFAAFRGEVASRTALARAQDEAKARRIERNQMSISQEALGAYQKEIADLRARADARRVQPDRSAALNIGGSGDTRLPGVSQPTPGIDGAAGEDGLSESDQLIASEIAVRLLALQNWIRRQQKASQD